ncbi:50S ribosomal protein L3, partial [bacterium]|nr:50S ribosomal protein L3 [bacterium]
MKFILGKKIGMTQIWKENKVIPVTLIEAGPCFVTQIKTKEKDGYQAVQLGFEKIEKEKKIKKSQKNKPFRYLREFRLDNVEEFKVGDVIDVSRFEPGEKVKVSGISKGKGFQGVVKRWGFSGRNATHGVKHEERKPGSIGSAFPQRVIKGKKMPGRMGNERVTIKNLE